MLSRALCCHTQSNKSIIANSKLQTVQGIVAHSARCPRKSEKKESLFANFCVTFCRIKCFISGADVDADTSSTATPPGAVCFFIFVLSTSSIIIWHTASRIIIKSYTSLADI